MSGDSIVEMEDLEDIERAATGLAGSMADDSKIQTYDHSVSGNRHMLKNAKRSDGLSTISSSVSSDATASDRSQHDSVVPLLHAQWARLVQRCIRIECAEPRSAKAERFMLLASLCVMLYAWFIVVGVSAAVLDASNTVRDLCVSAAFGMLLGTLVWRRWRLSETAVLARVTLVALLVAGALGVFTRGVPMAAFGAITAIPLMLLVHDIAEVLACCATLLALMIVGIALAENDVLEKDSPGSVLVLIDMFAFACVYSAAMAIVRAVDHVHVLEREDTERKDQSAVEELKRVREAYDRVVGKEELMAKVSHDIRTPLNGILGVSELMESDRQLNPRQRHYVNIIRVCGSTLLQLINDVLCFEQLERGEVPIREASTDMHDVVHGVAAKLCDLVGRKNTVEVVLDVLPSVPRGIWADHMRLEQILVNLLSNAIRFTSEGYVRARISYETVEAIQEELAWAKGLQGVTGGAKQASERSQKMDWLWYMRIEVTDTGQGMLPADVDAVFGEFVQARDQGPAKKLVGSGLGLSIVLSLVRQMGGAIRARSEWRKGSSFIALLPMQNVEDIVQETLFGVTSDVEQLSELPDEKKLGAFSQQEQQQQQNQQQQQQQQQRAEQTQQQEQKQQEKQAPQATSSDLQRRKVRYLGGRKRAHRDISHAESGTAKGQVYEVVVCSPSSMVRQSLRRLCLGHLPCSRVRQHRSLEGLKHCLERLESRFRQFHEEVHGESVGGVAERAATPIEVGTRMRSMPRAFKFGSSYSSSGVKSDEEDVSDSESPNENFQSFPDRAQHSVLVLLDDSFYAHLDETSATGADAFGSSSLSLRQLMNALYSSSDSRIMLVWLSRLNSVRDVSLSGTLALEAVLLKPVTLPDLLRAVRSLNETPSLSVPSPSAGLDIPTPSPIGIGVASEKDQRLPSALRVSPSPTENGEESKGQVLPRRNIHVLVAEDNLFNQMVLVEFLGAQGCTVETALNGMEAVDLFRNSLSASSESDGIQSQGQQARRPFDLVLIDLFMPVMDGIAATRKIREMEAGLEEQAMSPAKSLSSRSSLVQSSCVPGQENDSQRNTSHLKFIRSRADDVSRTVTTSLSPGSISASRSSGARRVPIGVVTASSNDKDIDACTEAGVDAVLLKPLSMDALKTLLADWFPETTVPA